LYQDISCTVLLNQFAGAKKPMPNVVDDANIRLRSSERLRQRSPLRLLHLVHGLVVLRLFSKTAVQAYRSQLEARGLSASAINVQLAAIKKLAAEVADNGLLAPELAAGISKGPGARSAGCREGNWLTREQASRLLALPDVGTLEGKRDRAMLGLLIACRLRREELVRLTSSSGRAAG
jgi:site-specific recombinase XerD